MWILNVSIIQFTLLICNFPFNIIASTSIEEDLTLTWEEKLALDKVLLRGGTPLWE
jgi:hypothetical protein